MQREAQNTETYLKNCYSNIFHQPGFYHTLRNLCFSSSSARTMSCKCTLGQLRDWADVDLSFKNWTEGWISLILTHRAERFRYRCHWSGSKLFCWENSASVLQWHEFEQYLICSNLWKWLQMDVSKGFMMYASVLCLYGYSDKSYQSILDHRLGTDLQILQKLSFIF